MIEATNEPVLFDNQIVNSLNEIPKLGEARRGKSPKFHALHIREATRSFLMKLFEEPTLTCSPDILESVCKYFLEQAKCEPILKKDYKRFVNKFMILEASDKSFDNARRRKFDVDRYLGSKFAFITSLEPPAWANKPKAVIENYVVLLIAGIKDLAALEKAISNLKEVLASTFFEPYSLTWLTFVLYLTWEKYKLLKLKSTEPKFNKKPAPTSAACEPIFQKFSSGSITSEDLDSFSDYFQSIPAKKGKQARTEIVQKLFAGSFSFSQSQVANMLVSDRFGNRLLDVALYGICHSMVKSHGDRDQFLEKFFSVAQDPAVKAQYIKDLRVQNLNAVMMNTHAQTKSLRREVPHPIYSELAKVPEIAKFLGMKGPTAQVCFFPDQAAQPGYYRQILDLIKEHPKPQVRAVLTRKFFANRVDYSNDHWKQHVGSLEVPYIHLRIASKLMSNTFTRHMIIATYQFYLRCRNKLSQKEFLASQFGAVIQKAFITNFECHKKANFLYTIESANKESIIKVLRVEDFLFSCIAYYNIFEDVTPFKDCLLSFSNLPAADGSERNFDTFTLDAAKSVLTDHIDDILEGPQVQSTSQIGTAGNAIFLAKFARKIFHHSLMSGLLTEKAGRKQEKRAAQPSDPQSRNFVSLDLLRALAGQHPQAVHQKHFTIAAYIREVNYRRFEYRSSPQNASRNAKRLSQFYTLLKTQANAQKEEIYELLFCSCLTNSLVSRRARSHGSYFFEGLVQPWLGQAKFGNLVQEMLQELIARRFCDQMYWATMWFVGRFYPKAASNPALQNYCTTVLKLTIEASKKEDPDNEIRSNNRYLGDAGFKKVLQHIHSQYSGGPIDPKLLVEIYNLQNPNKFAQVLNTGCFSDEEKLRFLLKSTPDIDSRRLPEAYQYMRMPGMTSAGLRSFCESYRLNFSDLDAADVIIKLNSLSNYDFARVSKALISNKPVHQKTCIFVAPIMVRSLRRFAACVSAVQPEEWQDLLFMPTQEITENPEIGMTLTDYVSCYWRPLVSVLAESASLRKGYYTKTQGKRTGGPWTASNLEVLREAGKFYGPAFGCLLQEVDLLDQLHPKENIKQTILSFINQVSQIAQESEDLLKSITKTSVDDYGICGPQGEGFSIAKERSDQPFPSMNVKVFGSDEEGQPLKENDHYFASIKKLADLRALTDSINSNNTIKILQSIEDKHTILQELISLIQGGNFTYQDVFAAVALSFFASDEQQRRDLHGSLNSSKAVEQVMAGYLKTALNSAELKRQAGFRPEAFQAFERSLAEVKQTHPKLISRPMKNSEELLLYGTINILSCLQESDMNAVSADLSLMSKINKHISNNPQVVSDIAHSFPNHHKRTFKFSPALTKQIFSNETEGHLIYQRICLAVEKLFAQIEDFVQLVYLTSKNPKLQLNSSGPHEVSDVVLTCKADRQGASTLTQPTRSTLIAEYDPTVPYGKAMLPHVKYIDEIKTGAGEKKVSFVIGTRIHPSFGILSNFCEELGELSREIKKDYGEEELVGLVLAGKDPFTPDSLRALPPQKQELFSVPEANFKYQFKIAIELIKMESIVKKVLDSAFAEINDESLTRDLFAANKRDLGFSSVSEWYEKVYGPVPKAPAAVAKPQQAKKK